MTSTVAVIGALGGAAICLTGGWIGAKAVLQAAVNDEQRFALKQMLSWGGAYAAVVLAVILLTTFQVFPQWGYVAALAMWFGPLFPALSWAHHRLDAAGQDDIAASYSAA